MSLFRRRAMSDQEKSADLVNIPYVVVTDATPFATVRLEAGKTYLFTGRVDTNVLTWVSDATTIRVRTIYRNNNGSTNTVLTHRGIHYAGGQPTQIIKHTFTPSLTENFLFYMAATNCTHETTITNFVIKEV